MSLELQAKEVTNRFKLSAVIQTACFKCSLLIWLAHLLVNFSLDQY